MPSIEEIKSIEAKIDFEKPRSWAFLKKVAIKLMYSGVSWFQQRPKLNLKITTRLIFVPVSGRSYNGNSRDHSRTEVHDWLKSLDEVPKSPKSKRENERVKHEHDADGEFRKIGARIPTRVRVSKGLWRTWRTTCGRAAWMKRVINTGSKSGAAGPVGVYLQTGRAKRFSYAAWIIIVNYI